MFDDIGYIKESLHEKKNVVATGYGYKIKDGELLEEPALIVSVEKKEDLSSLRSEDVIPKQINGVITDVIETGPIRALNFHRERIRPAKGGASIGHKDITAGTLGCLVEKDGVKYILSNNHVLANSNKAFKNDEIIQPGRYDGGTIYRDKIGILYDSVIIKMHNDPIDDIIESKCPIANTVANILNKISKVLGSDARMNPVSIRTTVESNKVPLNYVDAAIAIPSIIEDVSSMIIGFGDPAGINSIPMLGMNIKKSGRTTGVTSDRIIQVDVTVDVDFGSGQKARFTDQLMAGPMSAGGDSGSIILDDNNKIVGLLFAGSPQVTIFNKISRVMSELDVFPVCGGE